MNGIDLCVCVFVCALFHSLEHLKERLGSEMHPSKRLPWKGEEESAPVLNGRDLCMCVCARAHCSIDWST
jgi:hypothetical protein